MVRITLAIFLCSVSAFANTGRSLPSGEDSPRAIMGAYNSKSGEVHFLEEKGALKGALLRTNSGTLMELVRTEGPRECDQFGLKQASGCRFFFSDGVKTAELTSQDLEELNLFQSISQSLQARARHVSL